MTPAMKLYSPAAITALTEKHGFKLSKRLGQNFLADGNIVDKIIEAAQIDNRDAVIEIGPGMGALTAAAAERAAVVIAVEIDKALIPLLADALGEYKNIEIIHNDILKENLSELIKQYAKNARAVKIIGNLPYYITTPVIMKMLEERTAAESMTVMVQKEVADRVRALPGTRAYGAITASINYYCTVRHIADVPRSVFVPKPNVDSAILRLDIRKSPPVSLIDERDFFACVRSGFGQRRKTLQNSLTGLYGLDKQGISNALANASIDPSRRAETLDLFEFATLADSIHREAALRNK